jgi:hypothetical protein
MAPPSEPSSSCPSSRQAISPAQRGTGTTWSDDSLLALLDRPHQRASIEFHPVDALTPPQSPQGLLGSHRHNFVDILEEALLLTQEIEQELWGETQEIEQELWGDT